VHDHLRVEVEERPDVLLISLSGELDLTGADRLEEAVDGRLPATPRGVIVDLRELEFMDSTGLRALLVIADRAAELGHRFAVVRGRRQVQRLLELTGMSEHLTLIDDPDEILSAD
jgi:anti-anti-sigma factor